VIQLDLHATALAAVGVAPKAEWKVDGVDLAPFLTGKETGKPHVALYWRFGEQMAVRRGDWKLVKYDPNVEGRKGRATPAKLYNLREDIGEMTDLSAKDPDTVKELQAAWNEWNKDNVAPLWGGGAKKN
jgi:arylsulfatase A-like enzyme